MRGKGRPERILRAACRITPAYAGKSVRFPLSIRPERDHPRLCGEKAESASKAEVETGSPPPMRGKD